VGLAAKTAFPDILTQTGRQLPFSNTPTPPFNELFLDPQSSNAVIGRISHSNTLDKFRTVIQSIKLFAPYIVSKNPEKRYFMIFSLLFVYYFIYPSKFWES
jgi:hypothetical protein